MGRAGRLASDGLGFGLGALLCVAALLRAGLIVFGEWQDAHMEVRYTDIDYTVFSDAARLMVEGKSPFERDTYRYSPLLALVLVPNVVLHRCWGKILFAAAGRPDLLNSVQFVSGFRFRVQFVEGVAWLRSQICW